MGDNKKRNREEAERLLLDRLPLRLPQLKAEFEWACGVPVKDGAATPPPWVRYAIRRVWDISDDDAHSQKFTREDVAGMFGFARGLLPASLAALNQPIQEDDPDLAAKLELFRQKTLGATTPQWEGLGKALEAVPDSRFHGSLQEVVAFHQGQQEASAFVLDAMDSKGGSDPVTVEVLWFLWLFWPEVQTAKSVPELLRWLTGLRFIVCGQKHFEKICRMVGLRLNSRGRKRIPTRAR